MSAVAAAFAESGHWYPPRHRHMTTISGRAANDPRQHARQRRAGARRVLLAVPSSGVLSADRWPDAMPVPTFGPRMLGSRAVRHHGGDRRGDGCGEGRAEIGPGPAAPASPVRLSGVRAIQAPRSLRRVGGAATGSVTAMAPIADRLLKCSEWTDGPHAAVKHAWYSGNVTTELPPGRAESPAN
jgi:hypothetical protein